jgi:hypothetical protein
MLHRRTIYDDPFIRNYIEDLLKNIRTQARSDPCLPLLRLCDCSLSMRNACMLGSNHARRPKDPAQRDRMRADAGPELLGLTKRQ